MNACAFFEEHTMPGEHTMLHRTHGMHSDSGSATATRLPRGLSSGPQPYLPRVKRTDVMGFRASGSARRPPLGC